jgi:two-component system, NtrC family, response regulator AtoC
MDSPLSSPVVTQVSTLDARPLSPVGVSDSAYVLLFETQLSRQIPIPAHGQLTIGRDESCDVVLNDLMVSRVHGRIIFHQDQYSIVDLGSQNGTVVNGAKVVDSMRLHSGDTIGVGSSTLIFFRPSGFATPGTVLDKNQFLQRLEQELHRARHFHRTVAVAVFVTDSSTPALHMVPPPLLPLEIGAWLEAGVFALALPESSTEDIEEAVARVRRGLPQCRSGYAFAPDDSVEADGLLQAATAAATSAAPGNNQPARPQVQTFSFAAHTVLVAEPAMAQLYQLVQRLAHSALPVLICGETGTGKELVATPMHGLSERRDGPFVAINCAALPEALLESTLFGHIKGAFTGAHADKAGLFEAAHQGTLFLDEVADLSLTLQAKLLRVIETKTLHRVGDVKDRTVDVRLVAATHREMLQEVKDQRFRQDLYYRLAGATLWVPPLRARPRELPLLTRSFLENACADKQGPKLVLSPGALHCLASYSWPGNIRELKHVVEFLAATVTTPVVESWHVEERLRPFQTSVPQRTIDLNLTGDRPSGSGQPFRPIAEEIRELELRRMREALEAHGWNQTRAAAAIQMPLRTFVTRYRQYGLHPTPGQ